MEIINLRSNIRNYVIELTKIARSDLESSKDSILKGHYSNACNSLQQSLEKTIKALLLIIKYTEPYELKRIGHTPFEWTILRVSKELRNYSEIKRKIQRYMKKFRKKLYQYGIVCDEFINELWNRINSILVKSYEYIPSIEEFISKYRQLKKNKVVITYLFNKIDEYKRKEVENFFNNLNNFSNYYDSEAYKLLSDLLEIFKTRCMTDGNATLPTHGESNMLDLIKQMLEEYSIFLKTFLIISKYLILVNYLHLIFEIVGSTIRYPEIIDEKIISPTSLSKDSYIVVWCEKTIEFLEREKIFEQLKTMLESFNN